LTRDDGHRVQDVDDIGGLLTGPILGRLAQAFSSSR
jgi:hypothetical protein